MVGIYNKTEFLHPFFLKEEELGIYDVDLRRMVLEGAKLFESLFGYKSLSVVAPNFCWTEKVERLWNYSGVKYIQGADYQFVGSMIQKRHHYLGERNKFGQHYLIRNCYFEPSAGGNDPVGACLKQVERAFSWHKPAIILSHRANYIGSVFSENRTNGLNHLRDLLKKICRKWSDVVFLTSPELGYMMKHKIKDSCELRDKSSDKHCYRRSGGSN